jgi:hypothetical protein
VVVHRVCACILRGSAQGAGAPAEPVWMIRGGTGYPFSLVIGKKDGMVLESVLPQGEVGQVIDRYLETR